MSRAPWINAAGMLDVSRCFHDPRPAHRCDNPPAVLMSSNRPDFADHVPLCIRHATTYASSLLIHVSQDERAATIKVDPI